VVAKHCKPFSEGEFVKTSMLDVAIAVCPENTAAFQDVSLSKKSHLLSYLKEAIQKVLYFSTATDEY
jgi:TRAP-type uncharacterized transport system substrate-binding protein